MDTEKNPESLISQGEKIETRGRKRLPEGLKKVQRNISIQSDIWDVAVEMFPGEVSAMVERFLSRAIRRGRK